MNAKCVMGCNAAPSASTPAPRPARRPGAGSPRRGTRRAPAGSPPRRSRRRPRARRAPRSRVRRGTTCRSASPRSRRATSSSRTSPMIGSPRIPRSRGRSNEMRAALNTTTPAPTPATAASTAGQRTGAAAERHDRRAAGEPAPLRGIVDARELGPHGRAPAVPRSVQARRLEGEHTLGAVAPHGVARDPPRDDRRGEREGGPDGHEGRDELERVAGRILLGGARRVRGLPPHPHADHEVGADRRDQRRRGARASTRRRGPRARPPRRRAGGASRRVARVRAFAVPPRLQRRQRREHDRRR